jgi:hypothetical protein
MAQNGTTEKKDLAFGGPKVGYLKAYRESILRAKIEGVKKVMPFKQPE